jgi:hypothetical protein
VVGAEVRRFSSDRRGLALNLFVGIAGGTLGSLAETLMLPSMILSFFVAKAFGSYTLIGLVPALGVGLWSLARLPAAILTRPQRRKLPWAIGAALIRAAAVALLAAVCFRAGGADAEGLLRSFFICYVAYTLASGFASVPTAAVLAKAIPDEGRPLFFRQRALWGGAAGLAAGVVVARLFGSSPPLLFPDDYALLFLAATVCQAATAFFVSTIREPVRLAESRASFPLGALRLVPEALADRRFRRFLSFRALLSLTALIDPFLIIFAATRLGVVPDQFGRFLGPYVLAFVAGRLLTAPLWAALANQRGDKATLQAAALLRLWPPLLALFLPYLAGTALYRNQLDDALPLATLFGTAFVALGASLAAQARGNFGYLAEAAPTRLRAAYAALTNVVLGVVAFAPVLGGLLLDGAFSDRFRVDAGDYEALFLLGAGLGLLAVFASGVLTDTFVRATRSAGSLRLRGPAPALRRR